MTNFIYTASNTDLQVLDTFDLPTTKTIHCEVHALDRNESSVSEVVINHNGIETSESQIAISVSNNRPAEITTDIVNNVGVILIQPTVAPTQYSITQNVVECNLYSENTVSGRLILANEGIGMFDTNLSIRQADNNFFGYANTFESGNTLGPITTRAELYEYDNLADYKDSQKELQDDIIVITSSGQLRNHHYLELEVTPGTRYLISCNAYYTFDKVYANEDTFDINTKITVGESISDESILYKAITDTSTLYNLQFTATGNTCYIGFGYGALGSNLFIENLSVKEYVPFHTYNQLEGTFYFKWNALPAGSPVVSVSNNLIQVDASNNIFINTVNCGSQQVVNKIAFAYDGDIIKYSKNGSLVTEEPATYYSNTLQLGFENAVEEFSYVPEILSNASIIGLTYV